MAQFIHGRKVIDALIESGVADENTQRVVLDIAINGVVTAYVQKVGDTRVLDVIATMTGDTIVLANPSVTTVTEDRK